MGEDRAFRVGSVQLIGSGVGFGKIEMNFRTLWSLSRGGFEFRSRLVVLFQIEIDASQCVVCLGGIWRELHRALCGIEAVRRAMLLQPRQRQVRECGRLTR